MGTIIEFSDLKAPDPLEGKPPWQDSRWLAAAEGWIDAECARAGLTRIGPASGRGRPYSVVARVPTASGTVWFKANPPAARFEPALLVALADWHPDRFAAPIAVDLDRAWSLTRDGGPTLRERASPGMGSPEASDRWPTVLRGYARLQADLAPHAADLLSLGLADLRPGSVPAQFEKLLGNPHIEAAVGTPDGLLPAAPSTGETPRSRIRSPAFSSPCGRRSNRSACRRDPRQCMPSPRATSVPGSRQGTGGQPSTAHSPWRCGLPRSPAP